MRRKKEKETTIFRLALPTCCEVGAILGDVGDVACVKVTVDEHFLFDPGFQVHLRMLGPEFFDPLLMCCMT